MGLFSRHADPATQPAPQRQPAYEEPPKKHGLFSRHAEPAHQPVQPAYEEPPRKHGLFGSRHQSPGRAPSAATRSTRSSSLSSSPDRTGRRSGGLLHRNRDEMDPSIIEARERVMGAEHAEREADRALMAARASTREAREHVRRLELEAKEDARLAKIKQHHAKEVSKRGKQLGREYPRRSCCA